MPKRYAWKSAKWLTGLEFTAKNKRGFWEVRGYHIHAEPFGDEATATRKAAGRAGTVTALRSKLTADPT